MKAAIDAFQPDISEDRPGLKDMEQTTAALFFKNENLFGTDLKKTPIKRGNRLIWKFCVDYHYITACGGLLAQLLPKNILERQPSLLI